MPHSDDGRAAARRPARTAPTTAFTTALTALLALGAAGCASLQASNAADTTKSTSSAASSDPRSDPGCADALKAVSRYGPSSVRLLAEGREAVNTAVVQLLVTALDAAANSASQPQVKSDIKTLARAYEDYFDLTTDVTAIPLEVLLKDSIDLQGLCDE